MKEGLSALSGRGEMQPTGVFDVQSKSGVGTCVNVKQWGRRWLTFYLRVSLLYFFFSWSIVAASTMMLQGSSHCWGVIDHWVSLEIKLLLAFLHSSRTLLTFHSGSSWSCEILNWMESSDVFMFLVEGKGEEEEGLEKKLSMTFKA